ncbi:hypothetical protein EVAR_60906_1 [Eumeta japonica]|uniref:Histone-lysine N-methyltransferase SETMAR n=1 Tax=Eumeta variegata TaxID=151549 RepID=A0A4C1ZII0_EUMVA|nr:hypothetical protein EVAR_60906_1 [Eumeta japonica]
MAAEKNLINHELVCDSTLKRNETEPFLKGLITGDEKWITYDKNMPKTSWSKGKLVANKHISTPNNQRRAAGPRRNFLAAPTTELVHFNDEAYFSAASGGARRVSELELNAHNSPEFTRQIAGRRSDVYTKRQRTAKVGMRQRGLSPDRRSIERGLAARGGRGKAKELCGRREARGRRWRGRGEYDPSDCYNSLRDVHPHTRQWRLQPPRAIAHLVRTRTHPRNGSDKIVQAGGCRSLSCTHTRHALDSKPVPIFEFDPGPVLNHSSRLGSRFCSPSRFEYRFRD